METLSKIRARTELCREALTSGSVTSVGALFLAAYTLLQDVEHLLSRIDEEQKPSERVDL